MIVETFITDITIPFRVIGKKERNVFHCHADRVVKINFRKNGSHFLHAIAGRMQGWITIKQDLAILDLRC